MVLVTLMIIGMVKELLADMKRYKTDKLSNALPTQLLTGKLLEKSQLNSSYKRQGSKQAANMAELARQEHLSQMQKLETRTVRTDELKVGDIIKVMDDEIIPADCFILASGSTLAS